MATYGKDPDLHRATIIEVDSQPRSKGLFTTSLIPLPPHAPDLSPMKRVWLYLRKCLLSHRLLDSYEAIIEACREAWKVLTPARLRSLTAFLDREDHFIGSAV